MDPAPAIMKALIVDDEIEACKNLKNILCTYITTPIEIIGMAQTIAVASCLLTKHEPDIIFLDIEMQNENGFMLFDGSDLILPNVIFVTAYDEYAVKAFRSNAVDYILKPVSIPDLENAIKKVSDRINYKKLMLAHPVSYTELSGQMSGRSKVNKLILKDGHNIDAVSFSDILYIEANGSYAKVTYRREGQERSVVMSYSVAEYEDIVPADMFYRIHKSYLINGNAVLRIVKEDQHYVVLKNGIKFPVSRRRYTSFMSYLKEK